MAIFEIAKKWNLVKIKFREIAFLAVLNLFPVQKLIFGYFWNSKKWILIYMISRVVWPAVQTYSRYYNVTLQYNSSYACDFDIIWKKGKNSILQKYFMRIFEVWSDNISQKARKIKKSPGQKNSWNQINQLHENSIFCNFKNSQKSIFELGKSLKLPKIQCHKKFFIFLFDFTSFFAWTFLNFLAYYASKFLNFLSKFHNF